MPASQGTLLGRLAFPSLRYHPVVALNYPLIGLHNTRQFLNPSFIAYSSFWLFKLVRLLPNTTSTRRAYEIRRSGIYQNYAQTTRNYSGLLARLPSTAQAIIRARRFIARLDGMDRDGWILRTYRLREPTTSIAIMLLERQPPASLRPAKMTDGECATHSESVKIDACSDGGWKVIATARNVTRDTNSSTLRNEIYSLHDGSRLQRLVLIFLRPCL